MTSSISRSVDDKRPVVLISGATGRIGKVLAPDFAKWGWDVGLHSYPSQADHEAFCEPEQLTDNIRNAGGRGVFVGSDRAVGENAADIIESCSRELGNPVCLINQHFISGNGQPDAVLSDAFAAFFPENKKGNIINIFHFGSGQNTPHLSSHKTYNSQVWACTHYMAYSLAPSIRVNTIGIGSDLQGATPKDIASAVRFILEAPSMTGQIIMLDDAL